MENLTQPRVLIVEDHPPCAHLMEILLSNAGYGVMVATSVEAAMFMLAKEKFYALVCDLLLPDGNGCDIIKVVREKGDKLLAIAVTGLLPMSCQAEAMASGFDAFLSKPFRPQALVDLLTQRE